MRNKNIFSISFLLIIGFSNLNAQKFISNRQSYIDGNSTESKFLNETRYVLITGDNFEIELPDNTLLIGKLSLKSDEIKDGKKIKIYETDKECIIVINNDNVFLNLYRTHNTAYTYYLDNYVEQTDEEKQAAEEEAEYKLNIKLYGKFTADCIKEGKVKPGMDGVAVLKILGTPNAINQTETVNMMSEQLVYDDMYVYIENGKVTAIQKRIETK